MTFWNKAVCKPSRFGQ